MSKYIKHLESAIGLEGAAKLIAEKGINFVAAELQRAGEHAKENQGETGAEHSGAETAGMDELVSKIVTEVLASVDEISNELEALKEDAQKREKALSDQAAAREADQKVISVLSENYSALEKKFQEFMEATPKRASESRSTEVSDSEKEKINKNRPQYDPDYPGMNVPLKEGK